MVTIRGAITIKENSKDAILDGTKELLKEIIDNNDIQIEDILSITFTATKDLTKVYPAVAARELGIVAASLICMQEMYVEGSLEQCIRVMFLVDLDRCQNEIHHIYLKGAKILRPDIND